MGRNGTKREHAHECTSAAKAGAQPKQVPAISRCGEHATLRRAGTLDELSLGKPVITTRRDMISFLPATAIETMRRRTCARAFSLMPRSPMPLSPSAFRLLLVNWCADVASPGRLRLGRSSESEMAAARSLLSVDGECADGSSVDADGDADGVDAD